MTALIENLAKALVDAPDQVIVNTHEREGGKVLELHVAAADLGKVIGRQGRTARSLRAILGAAALKHNSRVTLEIAE